MTQRENTVQRRKAPYAERDREGDGRRDGGKRREVDLEGCAGGVQGFDGLRAVGLRGVVQRRASRDVLRVRR